MRRTVPLALLALLSACSVTTTGAPCSSDANCPSDQGCGSDRTCSTAALACPGHAAGGECLPGTSCSGGQVVTCTPSAGVCTTRSAAPCGDPGQSCATTGGTAACACPTTAACTTLDATRCGPGGAEVQRCRPVVTGSACLAWQLETSCSSSGLVCSASACVCPANPGPTFVADPVSGSTAGAPPHATGVASPPSCRFSTLTEALQAASGRGPGSIVRAAGWTASPGTTVLFVEPGALQVGPGISLTTDDATPVLGHYAVTTPASVSTAIVTLGPGASMTGLEVQRGAATGDGLRTACASATDTAAVTLATVRVAAASGTPVTRLANGIHVTGHCPVAMTSVTVDGAATGLLVESAAETVESTAASSRIENCSGPGASVLAGRLTLTGGAVSTNGSGVQVGASGTGAPTFTATGTGFDRNALDGVFLARGSVVADSCPFSLNGTHVRAQPAAGASVALTVRNTTGAATMTGATDSALRLLAMGAGSSLDLTGIVVRGNGATTPYTVASGPRRGGGIVFTAPFPGTVVFRGNTISQNAHDQVLVAASTGSLDLRGGGACLPATTDANTFKCYDTANAGVGLYSNGASVAADSNHWTNQPAVVNVDFAGAGITGENAACTLDRACP